jgi:hypothetical protein
MTLDEPRRTSRGLPGGRPRPIYIFEEYPETMEPDELAAMNLQKLRDQAKEFGYNSLFDVALADAKSSRIGTARREFVESGGFDEFCRKFQRYIPKPEPPPEPAEEEGRKRKVKRDQREPIFVDANNEACNIARDIYFQEFESLRNDSTFRAKMINITNETIVSVDLSEFYRRMKAKAPCLFALIETLYPELEEEPENEAEESNVIDLTDEALVPSNDADNSLSIGNVLKAKKRKIREQRFVMAMFVLGGYTGQRFNLLHGLIGNFLWQYNAPIKVIDTLHHLGVSASYSGLEKIWRERAKENISQASIVPNNPSTPNATSTALDKLPHSVTNHHAFTSTSGSSPLPTQHTPNPTLSARTPLQSVLPTDNKRNAGEITEGGQSIGATAKKKFVERRHRHTWRESPKLTPPEWRPNVLRDQKNFQSVTQAATSAAPIPLPQTFLSKPTESPTHAVIGAHHWTNTVKPGAVTFTSTPQQKLDKSTVSGQGYMSMGLNMMQQH